MEEAGKVFLGWEEVTVSNDRGRREVHYYLRDAAGGMDLAVVGREKSARHMSYAVPWSFLRSFLALGRGQHLLVSGGSPPPLSSSSGLPPLKWRSRREVVDWLSSLVSDSISYGSSPEVDRFSDDEDAEATDIPTSKGLSSGKMGHHSKEFSWLGSAWNCRKRRKHYRSFCRNGVTISVHNFVYVMTEENKRLIAYVEDLYEDLRANNMVVVRWFHKADEVANLLPPVINDREIFFSLCLQDFSVECIDGLAAVLSAQHFEKFQNEARHSNWEPYLCCRQINNDDVKPFNIAHLQGYWSQELLRSMFTPRKLRLKITCGGSRLDGDPNCHVQSGLEKKHRLSSGRIDISGMAAGDTNKKKCLGSSSKVERHTSGVISAPGLLGEELFKQKFQQQLSPGCQVEVLSQDSGMRGCWFRCVILKRQHDKVKVRYQDVQDADENGNLEEWVLLSRVAAPDKLGIRMHGRPMVRPNPSESGRLSCSFDVGAVIDAWWHDGWWEGIVIRKQSEGQFHVYFPGEKRVSIFSRGDLRPSQDWISNKWNHIKDRKDIISSLLPDMKCENQDLRSDERIPAQSPDTIRLTERETQNESSAPERNVDSKLTPQRDSLIRNSRDVPNLAEACHLDGLKWCSSKKRKRRTEFSDHGPKHRRRQRCEVSSSISREASEKSGACGGVFMLPKSLTVDHENCKIAGDPLFSASMTLSSLVMSR